MPEIAGAGPKLGLVWVSHIDWRDPSTWVSTAFQLSFNGKVELEVELEPGHCDIETGHPRWQLKELTKCPPLLSFPWHLPEWAGFANILSALLPTAYLSQAIGLYRTTVWKTIFLFYLIPTIEIKGLTFYLERSWFIFDKLQDALTYCICTYI